MGEKILWILGGLVGAKIVNEILYPIFNNGSGEVSLIRAVIPAIGSSLVMLYFFSKAFVTKHSKLSLDQQEKESDENEFWKAAMLEFNNNRNDGLWSRLYSECDGDENKAKARYLKICVENYTKQMPVNPKSINLAKQVDPIDPRETFIGSLKRGDLASIGALIALIFGIWVLYFDGIGILTGTKILIR